MVLPESNVEFESAIIGGRVNKLVCTPSALGVLDVEKVSRQIEAVQVAGEAPRLSILSAWNKKVDNLFIGLGPTEVCMDYLDAFPTMFNLSSSIAYTLFCSLNSFVRTHYVESLMEKLSALASRWRIARLISSMVGVRPLLMLLGSFGLRAKM